MAEQSTHNPKIEGSNLATGAGRTEKKLNSFVGHSDWVRLG